MKKLVAIALTLTLLIGMGITATAAVPEIPGRALAYYTNAQKAVAVLESLETGDPEPIRTFVSRDGYIQHNLTFADGRKTMLDALPALVDTGCKVEIQRVYTDGSYVFLHTKYNLFGEDLVGFDIFRFEDGMIVEHWDNLSPVTPPGPSRHTQFDGAVEVQDIAKKQENKQLVRGFVQDVLMGQNPDKLTSYFDGNNYIQHNSGIADGLDGLGAALADMAENNIEMVYDRIHKVLGDSNFVLVVSEGTFAGEHTSYYDLFRVENGKIAEHWDVIETILPETEHAHSNGKF